MPFAHAGREAQDVVRRKMKSAMMSLFAFALAACGEKHEQVRTDIAADELFYDSTKHVIALRLDDGSNEVLIFDLSTPDKNLVKISDYLDDHSSAITGAVFRLSRFDEFYAKSDPQARKSTWANFVFDRPIAPGDHNLSFGYNFIYDSLRRTPYARFSADELEDFDYRLKVPITGHSVDHLIRSRGEHHSGP